MLKVLSTILCDLDPKVKVIGQKANICDGIPSTSALVYVISVLYLLCCCARLFIDALWTSAGKGLTYWLSFVMSKCEVVTFPLVSWVRCGA